jgi:hypothetical protein
MTVLAVAYDLECLTQIGPIAQSVETLSTSYNSAYAFAAVQSITSSNSTTFAPVAQEQELAFATASGDFWFHGVLYITDFSNSDTGEILRFRSATGGEIRLRPTGAGVQALEVTARWEKTLNGTTWTAVGADFRIRYQMKHTFDFRIKLNNTIGEIKTYLNGVQVHTFTGDVSTQTNLVSSIYLGSSTLLGSTIRPFNWSELVVANEPTFDWHVATLPVSAAGTFSTWTGLFSDVDDVGINSADLISTNTATNQQTFNVMNTTASQVAGNAIKAYAVASRTAVTTDATPNDAQHIVRTGGTVFTTANLAIPKDGNYHTRNTVYNTNPNTSAAWTTAEIDAVEIGMKAVT